MMYMQKVNYLKSLNIKYVFKDFSNMSLHFKLQNADV